MVGTEQGGRKGWRQLRISQKKPATVAKEKAKKGAPIIINDEDIML